MQEKDLRRFIKTTEKMMLPQKVAATTQGAIDVLECKLSLK